MCLVHIWPHPEDTAWETIQVGCRGIGLEQRNAGIAQSVEQLIRNQQVVCSSHITSSNDLEFEGIPEQKLREIGAFSFFYLKIEIKELF